MASGNALQPNLETGWRKGLGVLLSRENAMWWKTRRWIVQVLIFMLMLNGIMLVVLNSPEEGQQGGAPADAAAAGLEIFITLAGFVPAISVIIVGQDTIIGEKQTGTAAWMLSKPVSRVAFILSKLIAHSLGYFVTAVVIQGVAAYIILTQTAGMILNPLSFFAGMLLLFLNLLFYITLSLMLGTLFQQRGGVMGIGLLLIFGSQIFTGFLPWLIQVMPWGLVTSGGSLNSLASTVALGQTPATTLPLIATLAWCVLFISVAIWRFEKVEF